jgi:7,8-dihydropterin-6-yl-methyl-4-(beta-D-ribofuranosyl)aminobenzene 5'-phosphate synthase
MKPVLHIVTTLITLTAPALYCACSPGTAPAGNAVHHASQKGHNVTMISIYDNCRFQPELKTDWGFASVVSTPVATVLFDTGGDARTLLFNMQKMNIAPCSIDIVFISHIHYDHVGGLEGFLTRNTNVTVFIPASFPDTIRTMITNRGAAFSDVSTAREIIDGLYTTGELSGPPEEQALVINSSRGLIVMTGCSHPGIIRIVKHVQALFPERNLHLVVGGFHHPPLSVVKAMRALAVEHVAPSHCTGERVTAAFKQEYTDHFIPYGVGKVIDIPAQPDRSIPTGNSDSSRFRRLGAETLARIEKDLRVTGTALYAEYGTPDGTRGNEYGRFSFVWPAGFQLRALAAAAKLEPDRYRAQLVAFAEALQEYWGTAEGTGGYMILPMKSERFYDDNAWLVLGLLDTYEVTQDPKYLARAEETMKFLFTGARTTPGGGIRQKEEPGGTFTCTTAPAAVGALRLYKITKDSRYLETAKSWYAWLTSKHVGVQDPETGLYHQGASLTNGTWQVKKGWRAYQSALPVQAALLLYEITGEQRYRTEAQRVASSCVERWILPSGAFKETGQWGGSDLVEALLQLYKVDGDRKWYRAVRLVLEHLCTRCRDPNGRYGEYWDKDRREKPLDRVKLLYMAPVAHAYWLAAACE